MSQLHRIIKAKTDLVLDHRFFGQLSMKMDVREDSTCPTCATDGKNFFFNPLYVAHLKKNSENKCELMGVVCHELLHCALGHLWRMGSRNRIKWNVACDVIINPIVLEAGLILPEGVVYPATVNEKYGLNINAGMSAEEVYNLLPDDVIQDFGCGIGEMLDPATWDSMTHSQQAWAKAAIAAARAVKSAGGNLPGSLEMHIDRLANPKADWRAALQHLTQVICANDDFTWRRPNKRYLPSGLYLPAMYAERVPPIRVYADSSGSCWAEEILRDFGGEISGVLSQCQPEILTVDYFDTQVHEGDEFYPGDDVFIRPKGGGGTDFNPIFQHVATKDNPAAVIILTDGYGYGPWPEEPDYPCIWAINSDVVAPWGTTLDIRP